MAYFRTDGFIGGQPIADTNSTVVGTGSTATAALHPICTTCTAFDATYGEGEFIYLKGVASTAVGSWVGFSPALGTTVLAIADGNYPLAVSMSANNTTTSYGWYKIRGQAQAKGLTSITHSSGFLWLTATAGSLDDASVIGNAVINARKTVAVHVVGTFVDTYSIHHPFVMNRVLVSN